MRLIKGCMTVTFIFDYWKLLRQLCRERLLCNIVNMKMGFKNKMWNNFNISDLQLLLLLIWIYNCQSMQGREIMCFLFMWQLRCCSNHVFDTVMSCLQVSWQSSLFHAVSYLQLEKLMKCIQWGRFPYWW